VEPSSPLTVNEAAVVRLVAAGLPDATVARLLGVSPSGAKKRLRAAGRKLYAVIGADLGIAAGDATSRTAIVWMAVCHGVVECPKRHRDAPCEPR